MKKFSASLAVALLVHVGLAVATSESVTGSRHVPGHSIDSGLGELPHYSQWLDLTGKTPMRYRVAGEKLDSGLGELPHYSQWLDPTGKTPMPYRVAGEKLDSGLGSLPLFKDGDFVKVSAMPAQGK